MNRRPQQALGSSFAKTNNLTDLSSSGLATLAEFPATNLLLRLRPQVGEELAENATLQVEF
jgi:hypothetical protein